MVLPNLFRISPIGSFRVRNLRLKLYRVSQNSALPRQLPLHIRVPKLKGFTNPFRVEYQAVNLDTLDSTGLDTVDPDVLHAAGLTHKGALVKVLGRGSIERAVTVKAHGFSRSAEAAITAAGGTVEVIPAPWGDRRPPAKGNQHTNR